MNEETNDKNKNDLMDAMLREISDKEDKLQSSARQIADFAWVYYNAYMASGFTETQAFNLTGLMIAGIVNKS